MKLKPSSIIIIISIVFVIFIGYQNNLVQRFFPDFNILKSAEKYAPPPPPADSLGADTVYYKMMNEYETSEAAAPAPSEEMRLMSPGPSSPDLEIIELRHQIEFLEYRVTQLENDYQIILASAEKKDRKFDDILALLGTLMPLFVTYITVKNKDKVDNAGARIKTFWNKK